MQHGSAGRAGAIHTGPGGFDVLLLDTAGMDGTIRPGDDYAGYANGGWVRSVEQVCSEIVRRLSRELASPSVRAVRVIAHPNVVETLIDYAKKYRVDKETGKTTFAIVQAEDELASIGMALGAGWKRQAAARKPEVAKVNSRNAARRRSAAFFAGS